MTYSRDLPMGQEQICTWKIITKAHYQSYPLNIVLQIIQGRIKTHPRPSLSVASQTIWSQGL